MNILISLSVFVFCESIMSALPRFLRNRTPFNNKTPKRCAFKKKNQEKKSKDSPKTKGHGAAQEELQHFNYHHHQHFGRLEIGERETVRVIFRSRREGDFQKKNTCKREQKITRSTFDQCHNREKEEGQVFTVLSFFSISFIISLSLSTLLELLPLPPRRRPRRPPTSSWAPDRRRPCPR